jgi:hypothetical protein
VNTAQNAAMKWIKLKVSSQTVTVQQTREMLGTPTHPFTNIHKYLSHEYKNIKKKIKKKKEKKSNDNDNKKLPGQDAI